MSTKDEVLQMLREQAADRRFNRLKFFTPYERQKDFCNATALPVREAVLQAGNQVGKSECGAYMAAVFATGEYPNWWQGRRFDGPTRGWCAGESAMAVRDISQRKLLGPPGDESLLGTGLIPKDRIIGKILSHGAGGAVDTVRVKHVSGGVSEISFKSYEQGREKWQGSTLNWLWNDEEPPVDLYLEGLARLGATEGLAYSTFTPLAGYNLILPRFREKTIEAQEQRLIVRMRMQDAKHFADDPAKMAAQMASYSAYQRKTRADGVPLMGSGSVFDIDVEDITDPIRLVNGEVVHNQLGPIVTRGWTFIWGVDFGIGHAFGAVLLAWDKDNDAVYVLHEIKVKNALPFVHARRMMQVGPMVPVAWPHDGNQRDKGSGEPLSRIYKREGLRMLGQHAQFPTGGYSFEAGITEMSQRFATDRLKLALGLPELRDEIEGYHRIDGQVVKTNDDLLSALRVGIMSLRFAQPAALGGVYTPVASGRGWAGEGVAGKRGPGRQARGTNFDLWDPSKDEGESDDWGR